jgi:hypothetical protein
LDNGTLGQNNMEIHHMLFGQVSLQYAIFGSHHFHHAFLDLEVVGASEMQDYLLVSSPK